MAYEGFIISLESLSLLRPHNLRLSIQFVHRSSLHRPGPGRCLLLVPSEQFLEQAHINNYSDQLTELVQCYANII
jgi:hypothetical protein